MVDFDRKNYKYGCRWLKTTAPLHRFDVEAVFTLACTQDPADAMDWDDVEHHAYDHECSCSRVLHHAKMHSFTIGLPDKSLIYATIMDYFDFNFNDYNVGWIRGEYPWLCAA